MLLRDLFNGVEHTLVQGTADREVADVVYDTRRLVGFAAGELGQRLHRAAVQRGGGSDQLEYRARLIQIAYRLVAPLGLLRQLQRGGALLPGQRVHRRAGGLVRDQAGLVGVVVGFRCHGQDGPGVHIHHDAHRPGGDVMLLHRVGQVLFQIVLDVGVDG